jgi:gamma-glutamyl hydrolase
VVPVPHYLPESELYALLGSINGIIFPGGFEDFYKVVDGKRVPDQFLTTVRRIMDWAKLQNDSGTHWPIWGICLGIQVLHYAIDINIDMQTVNAGFMPNTIKFTNRAKTSKLYHFVDDLEEFEKLTTFHNFNYAILPEHYLKHPKLAEFYDVLALTTDRNGVAIVSVIEAKRYPFYGVLFHPER